MTEKDLDERIAARQRRWRRLSGFVSGSLGVAAVGSAIYLGATGPLVSPVQPAAAPAAPAQAAAVDPGRTHPDTGRPGDGPNAVDSGHHR